MKNLQHSIGIFYGNKSAMLAREVEYYIDVIYGIDLKITDVGSGDTTGVDYNSEVYELTYFYVYVNETLTGINLQCDDIPLLEDGLVLDADESMRDLYKDIMLSTYLIEECMKINVLSNEAMAHKENWQDAI